MIGLPVVYALAGLVFGAFAILSALDRTNSRRWGNAVFWGLVATSFIAGDRLGDGGVGIMRGVHRETRLRLRWGRKSVTTGSFASRMAIGS